MIQLCEEKYKISRMVYKTFMLPIGSVVADLQIVEFLKELKTIKKGWIPCSEPPKSEGRYLVTVERCNERFVDIDYFNGRYFCWGDYAKVWRELPETYKEKDK